MNTKPAAGPGGGDSGTLYAQISPYYASDFVPSRETRVSTNPCLQEHLFTSSGGSSSSSAAASELLHPVAGLRPRSPIPVPLKGKYIELYFSSRKRSETNSSSLEEDLYSTVRRPHSKSDPAGLQFFGSPAPLPSTTRGGRHPSRLCDVLEEGCDMYRPSSFSLAILEDPIIFDGDDATQRRPKERHYLLSTGQGEGTSNLTPSPSSSPSPPPLPQVPSSFGYEVPPVVPMLNPRPSHQRTVQKSGSLEDLLSQRKKNHISAITNIVNSPGSKRRVSELEIARDEEVEAPFPVSFVGNSSGNEVSRFLISYLGSRDVDQYFYCVDECARRLIDNKATFKATEVLTQVCTKKIRLFPPTPHGPLFKSFSVSEILEVSQCSKNRRLVGIVLWKGKIPRCHLLRCPDQLVSNSLLQSLEFVIQSLKETTEYKVDDMQYSLPQPLPQDQLSTSFTAVYIGCTKSSAHKEFTVSDIITKALAEQKPSLSQAVSVNLSISSIEVKDSTGRILLFQHAETLLSLGVYQADDKYLGYITRDSSKSLAGHVFWCGTHQEVVNMVTALRQICQISYQRQQVLEETASETGLLSRLKSLKLQRSSPSNSSPGSSSYYSPSFHSYLSSTTHTQSNLLDTPRRRKDIVTVPTVIPSVSDISEEEYVKFSLSYIGTANLPTPFTPQSILQALEAFDEKGVAAGMAPPTGKSNAVSMYVSSLGINLTDKRQKMFVNRNYPRKQIVGYARHPSDERYFSFATLRPGFEDQVKVHLFLESSGQVVDQVIESIQFWLQIPALKYS